MINDDGFLIMEGYTIQFLNFVFGTQWPKNPISRSSTMSIIPKWDTQSDSTVVDWRICNIFPCTIAMISNGETLIFFNHVYIEFYLSWLYRIKQNVVGWFSPANLPSQLLFPWFSHDFPWFSHVKTDVSHDFPMFSDVSHDFPMFSYVFLDFPMFSYGFPHFKAPFDGHPIGRGFTSEGCDRRWRRATVCFDTWRRSGAAVSNGTSKPL